MVDCGIVVNPDIVEAQIQSGIIFGLTAVLWGEITLKNGRVEQSNFDDYRMLRGRIRLTVKDLPNQLYSATNPDAPTH